MRALLGLISYYRRYVPNFATVVAPITELTKGNSPKHIQWSNECVQALTHIQTVLSSQPILALPKFDKPFIVQTDASGVGLGAVLLQEYGGDRFPVAYVSRKLTGPETRYSTIERECLAIIWGISKLSRYLYGRKFILQTDHKPLVFLKTSVYHNSRIMRWMLALQEFQFSVETIKGTENLLADNLSRVEWDQFIP